MEVQVPEPGYAVDHRVVFQRLRYRLLANNLQLVLKGSSLRIVVILLCSLIIWGVVYAVSAEGFHLFQLEKLPLAGGIIGVLFDLLFLTLAVGLIFSSSIILFSSLFTTAETSFLLTTPARADLVFAYKFQVAIAFSSWGFLLLGSPVLVAYGTAYGVPWYFYVLLILFFLGFVLLPGSLGALLCLIVVNFMPRRRKQAVAGLILILVTCLGFWFYQLRPRDLSDAVSRDFIQRLLGQFAIAQGPLAPNHWMTRGLQRAAQGEFLQSVYYLALVWSNGLFVYVITAWAASRIYRNAFNRVTTGGTLRRRYGGVWVDRCLNALVGFLDPQTRLLIIKDFRTFRRDPAQWAQVAIFMGLMGFYFTNMRRFYQEDVGRNYQNGISLLNLAATSLLLCAYTGRFIYPLLSLEGRKFWILGLLPLRRDRLLMGKFAFSATWSLVIAEILVLFSDFMLGMSALVMGVHALTTVVLGLGLSGLSVGLGASMPNFRETDPSKIAVGFGGTLNLVAGLLFLMIAIGLMAGPLHMHQAALANSELLDVPAWTLVAGNILGVLVCAAAVFFPLRAGAQTLRKMEF